jgi:hypothetical protein
LKTRLLISTAFCFTVLCSSCSSYISPDGSDDFHRTETAGGKEELLLHLDFENAKNCVCTEETLKSLWGDINISSGVLSGRVKIVSNSTQGRVLQVFYPRDKFESADSGAQWKYFLHKSYQCLYCSYKIKFSAGFDFVKGGKLPGFAGGTANSGQIPSTGYDGFSARMMWRENGSMIQYVYHPGQAANTGDIFYWRTGSGKAQFECERWYRIEQKVTMNTPGSSDGSIECWLDGEECLCINNITFRYTDAYAIDIFYFSTFFGGDTPDWASSRNQTVCFDDFIISTERAEN